MSHPLRVLIVEDSEDDTQLLLRHLKKGDFEPNYRQVQTSDELQRALEETWDLVIADNSLPTLNAHEALEILKASHKDIPFIIVSGHIDDISAVSAMRAGAHDYLLKDNLVRLMPVIQRELQEARVRRDKTRAEEELRYHAHHDPLTGLLNRREFERLLETALSSAQERDTQHVLCYLDLDQFKLVNDTCGHMAGDEMLRQIAALLRKQLRTSDELARLGGDEFGLLLFNCTIESAEQVITKLRQSVEDFRFVWDDHSFDIGISIGMVVVHKETPSMADVLSAADVACYAAKELGRNRTHIYQPNDEELSRRRTEMQWVSRVTHALDRNRLKLFHQPVRAISDNAGATTCQEILIRMIGENDELIPPGAFIPAAERYKLMPLLDRWVVKNLFRMVAEAGMEVFGEPTDMIFVNLSGATINDESFLHFVKEHVKAYAIDPKRLCFEITESVAIANLANSLPMFQQLRELGCHFALDDFGSGLSSFGYLKNLPVDFVKIDGSFVRDLVDDPIDYAMVEAINKIGHIMNLRTVAESVESEAVLDKLKDIGIDFAQGYHLGMPAAVKWHSNPA